MKILDKEFEPKYGLRAMFVFEEITDKAFEIKTLLDTYIFCYSCLVCNQDNPSLEFNEFIDYCEDHPEVMEWFNVWMTEEMRKRVAVDNKKKVTRKGKGSR